MHGLHSHFLLFVPAACRLQKRRRQKTQDAHAVITTTTLPATTPPHSPSLARPSLPRPSLALMDALLASLGVGKATVPPRDPERKGAATACEDDEARDDDAAATASLRTTDDDDTSAARHDDDDVRARARGDDCVESLLDLLALSLERASAEDVDDRVLPHSLTPCPRDEPLPEYSRLLHNDRGQRDRRGWRRRRAVRERCLRERRAAGAGGRAAAAE